MLAPEGYIDNRVTPSDTDEIGLTRFVMGMSGLPLGSTDSVAMDRQWIRA